MHCLSRTPSTRKSQLGSHYSAISLKFDQNRIAAINRQHSVIRSANNSGSEVIEIRELVNIDEIRNFRTEPYVMMDQSYHAVVKVEPLNFSISQQTTSDSISRTSSIKKSQQNGGTLNSIAKKIKRCTQKTFIIKPHGDAGKNSNGLKASHTASMATLETSLTEKNSNLTEVDEDMVTRETRSYPA